MDKATFDLEALRVAEYRKYSGYLKVNEDFLEALDQKAIPQVKLVSAVGKGMIDSSANVDGTGERQFWDVGEQIDRCELRSFLRDAVAKSVEKLKEKLARI